MNSREGEGGGRGLPNLPMPTLKNGKPGNEEFKFKRSRRRKGEDERFGENEREGENVRGKTKGEEERPGGIKKIKETKDGFEINADKSGERGKKGEREDRRIS